MIRTSNKYRTQIFKSLKDHLSKKKINKFTLKKTTSKPSLLKFEENNFPQNITITLNSKLNNVDFDNLKLKNKDIENYDLSTFYLSIEEINVEINAKDIETNNPFSSKKNKILFADNECFLMKLEFNFQKKKSSEELNQLEKNFEFGRKINEDFSYYF